MTMYIWHEGRSVYREPAPRKQSESTDFHMVLSHQEFLLSPRVLSLHIAGKSGDPTSRCLVCKRRDPVGASHERC